MYQTNRLRGRCRCRCNQVNCTCGTCNYVLILLFCGARGPSDQYEVYFQGVLVATITDDATADDCRVFVIGNVSDVCESVITSLETTHGASAVTIGQTTTLDDVSDCDDEIELDVDCDEVTVEIVPLGGATVTGLNYVVYTVCHEGEEERLVQDGSLRVTQGEVPRLTQDASEEDLKNCCSYTSGGPLSGAGPDDPVSFSWIDTCCCCCSGFLQCVDDGRFIGTITIMNIVTSEFTITDGVRTYTSSGTLPDSSISPESLISSCIGAGGACFKEIDIVFTDGLPFEELANELLSVICKNGRLAVVVEPYEVRHFEIGVHEFGIYYSVDYPTESLIYQDDDGSLCDESDGGYSYALFTGVGYEFIGESPGPGGTDYGGYSYTFDILIECNAP